MSRIIFLLEERSMAETLRFLLPKIFPGWHENRDWIAIPHEGKSDLGGAIPRKLRAWNVPGDRFVIVRDNDGGDCLKLKSRLLELAGDRTPSEVLVRIVCQELEGWFLGDPDAVTAAYPHADRRQLASLQKVPDTLTNASELLTRVTKCSGKILRAKTIAPHLHPERNNSTSFRVFIEGVRRFSTP